MLEPMSELYEYPPDHSGSRSYVSVRGHSRSIPRYKTYKGTDSRYHLLPDYGGDWSGYGESSTYYIPDKAAYLSPLDFTEVSGRAAHREHMRKHDVIEAGDMKVGHMGRNVDRKPLQSAGHDIVRALREHGHG